MQPTRRASPAAPVRTVRVLTTVSLAVMPVIRAVEALQSPKPSGAKIGAIAPASRPSMLSGTVAAGVRCGVKD